jgi:hypothetical protein
MVIAKSGQAGKLSYEKRTSLHFSLYKAYKKFGSAIHSKSISLQLNHD